jgi:4-hydroxyphenylpyruvate dioxygenase
MGPFPHDAPPARISAQNPVGTDGFEFVIRPSAAGGAGRCSGEWAAPVARH